MYVMESARVVVFAEQREAWQVVLVALCDPASDRQLAILDEVATFPVREFAEEYAQHLNDMESRDPMHAWAFVRRVAF